MCRETIIRRLSGVSFKISAKFAGEVFRFLRGEVGYLDGSRPEEGPAGDLGYHAEWHGPVVIVPCGDWSQELDVPKTRFGFGSTYGGVSDFRRRNNPCADMGEEDSVSGMEVVDKTLGITECRNAFVLQHVPKRVFVVAAVGVEQHTLRLCWVAVLVIRQSEELEVSFFSELVNTVGKKLDRNPLPTPIVDRVN